MHQVIWALALLFLLAPPLPDPQLIARQDGTGAATISWQQSGYACLSREPSGAAPVLIGCWSGSGPQRVTLGHTGPLDGAYRPAAGDTYVLMVGDVTYRTPLRPPIWLPLARA